MTEYLILKLETDDPRSAKVVAHVDSDAEEAEAIKQGYDGEGRYAIVNWSERVEADLRPGPAEVSAVQDKKTREETAEAVAAEAASSGG